MERISIGEVATVRSGFAFKSRDWLDAGVPVIKIGNVKAGWVTLDGCSFVSEEVAKEAAAFELCPGNVLISMTGHIGEVARVRSERRMLLNQRVGRFIVRDAARLNLEFLYYCLQEPELKASMVAHAYGVAQPNISPSLIEQQTIPLPPLSVQRRIAGTLSAYDELIENNQRRIQILETMARALYREWFVEFRFPGHEKIPRVASAVGDIPKGWEAVPFEMLLASMTGGDWGSDQPTERESAEVRIVRGTDFDEVAYGGELRAPFRFIKPSSLKSRGLRPGDVIIENSINAKSRCVGTTLLVDQELLARIGRSAIAASFCKVFRLHDPRIAPLVHLHIRGLRQEGRMEYYQNVATNGIGNFQAQTFAKEEHLILPKNESLRSKLLERIDQMFECVGVMSSQLAYLRRTRDLLLPRLLSGQVTLTDTAA